MNLEKLRNNLYIFFTYHTNQSNFRVGHQVDNDKKQVIPVANIVVNDENFS